jgi:dinuclear metal center YbgI/SA1388 family protein
MNTITVADIISVMEEISPTYLAEDWDNVGLQIGSTAWPVNKIWIALDPLPMIIQKACKESVDLLITHHPLFFKPIRTLDLGTVRGNIIKTCIRNKLSVYSAHTNFDSVSGGLNDIFADRIGLHNRRVFKRPETLEMKPDSCHGIGRVGDLSPPLRLEQLAHSLKQRLHLSFLRMVGDPDLLVKKVAICTGSGSGLLNEFISSETQVYISGDLRYHDAIFALEVKKGLIDVGHFPSEQIMIDVMAKRLKKMIKPSGSCPITIEACHLECDPFSVLI